MIHFSLVHTFYSLCFALLPLHSLLNAMSLKRTTTMSLSFDTSLLSESALTKPTLREIEGRQRDAQPVVTAAPLRELVGGGRNQKYINGCVELHLASRGIHKLGGFELLTSLEVLYVNDNHLTALTKLDNNTRVKHLFAQRNQIGTLVGSSVLHMRYLLELDLSDNRLVGLDSTLALLSKLQFLRMLELRGNPLAEEHDYRLRVIFALPSLHIFDRRIVTDVERDAAQHLLGSAAAVTAADSVGFLTRKPAPIPEEVEAHYVHMSQLAQRNVDRVAAQADRRVAHEAAQAELKSSVVSLDPYSHVRPKPHLLTHGLPPPPGWPTPKSASTSDADGTAGMPDRKTLDVYKTYRHNDPSPADATELNRYVMPDGSRVAAAPGATEAEVKPDPGAAAVEAVEAEAAALDEGGAVEEEVPGLFGYHAERFRTTRPLMAAEYVRSHSKPPPPPPAGVVLKNRGRAFISRAL